MNKELLEKAGQIRDMVERLNRYRYEYYVENNPSISDSVYDHLFDELSRLEEETGIYLSNSPTQSVGYQCISSLKKVTHTIPLLSLDKTKLVPELINFLKKMPALLMLKLDGLTIKLVYEDGKLMEGSTRGDGDTGEDITHNIPAFQGVPLTIPYKQRLVVTGEGFIHKSDFEQLRWSVLDKNGKPYSTARGLASGSIRLYDAKSCRERKICFLPFHVLEGLDDMEGNADSRREKLIALTSLGFGLCPAVPVEESITAESLEANIMQLKNLADSLDIPIDGTVLRFDSLNYSVACGRTGHHFKDGIAFKFEDDVFETIFRKIVWQTSRNGEIAPVAIFDTVEIDGCDVSKASLHNLSFIKGLELHPGCRILVSKRNMIIPHIEDNLDRGKYEDMVPDVCPCCGEPTRIYRREVEKDRIVETLHCDNPECSSQVLRKFVHFAEKKAMNINGLSEGVLSRFLELGYLNTYQDLYHLDKHRDEIVALEGFGEKSYEKLCASIETSRSTTFVRFLVAMDIPMIGRTASRALDQYFKGNLRALEQAAVERFDFTCLPDFGETLSTNIQEWFRNSDHILLWRNLQKEFIFEERKEDNTMSENRNNSPFDGRTIVATGKLKNFTRDSINSKIISLGAIAGSSVTKKTDYLICGEKAGSKLAKAQELGVKVLSEQEFLDMLSA